MRCGSTPASDQLTSRAEGTQPELLRLRGVVTIATAAASF